jgi:hypothetical protein
MKKKEKDTITVQAWAAQKEHKLYKGELKRLRIQRKRLIALIEYVDPPAQRGRMHRFECDLPPRPGNEASRFLLACGANANTVGTAICINDVLGAVVGMQFHCDPTDRNVMQVEFQKIRQPSGTGSSPNDNRGGVPSSPLVPEEEKSEWHTRD